MGQPVQQGRRQPFIAKDLGPVGETQVGPSYLEYESVVEWAEVFGNDLLASAAQDRLTHHTHALTIRGSSCRQRQGRKEEHSASPALPAESKS